MSFAGQCLILDAVREDFCFLLDSQSCSMSFDIVGVLQLKGIPHSPDTVYAFGLNSPWRNSALF
jgi:hypothetical protein